MFVIEDIHWADPSTLEFLGLLLESIGAHRLCVVITSRPDYRLPIHFAASLTEINVGRLHADEEALSLVESALARSRCSHEKSGARSWRVPTACRSSSRSWSR